MQGDVFAEGFYIAETNKGMFLRVFYRVTER